MSAAIPAEQINTVKMGTTVATNALLERKGDRTAAADHEGLPRRAGIGYQARPDIFAKEIIKPELLYERVIEVNERVLADGTVEQPLDEALERGTAQARLTTGIEPSPSCSCMATAIPITRPAPSEIAREIGFTQISISHEVSPLMKLVGRGDTTVVDAYLSPILRRYVDQVASELGAATASGDPPTLMFMMSSGGLTAADCSRARTPSCPARPAASSAWSRPAAWPASTRSSASTWAAPRRTSPL
jgi:5-oxoprolinase (ATP-hydrolysing)